ncbi:glycosyltransferase family 2 protein [Candidatus Beckwithbacteria bacterium]|nr:glycosyltransferase family 2 protein [Candidatus Beckwithbacteria bacterium]
MTLVSVIIATYNEDQYLKKCLESLACQKKARFEIIVVDDGSFKKAKNLELKSKNGTFRFFRIKHSGTAVARNFGAKKAKGDILVFVDGDMEFEPDFLEQLIEPIEQGLAKGTISTEEYVANWNNVWARCWNFEQGLKTRKRIDEKDMMLRDFRAILKSEFDRVGGFSNTGYTDTWSLSEKLGYKPVKTKAKYYHYNPASMQEVFWQALWIGGRQRKFGIVGKIVAGLRATMPVSIFLGLVKAITYKEMGMLNFKIIYDLGILSGIMSGASRKAV